MRIVGLRFMRVIAVALLAYLALAGANAMGLPWLGYGVAGALFVGYGLLTVFESKKRSAFLREARWEQAIYDGKGRARAISEVSAARKKLDPSRAKTRAEFARLSVLLAELLDAEGDWGAARETIDAVPLDGLSALEAGLVRHTRAVVHLRAGDPVAALGALESRKDTGDVELDQRLELLEAYAQVENGDARPALLRAEAIAQRDSIDDSVRTEARVVRAAALDVLQRREEALVVLAALGRDSLVPLSQLGQPRVRALAKQILEGLEEE
ncbi:MAG: hypothetical protein QM778_25990 [Myxococcales bacterium]